jgi:CDP-glycerol glycerophosphotransferase
LGLASRVKNRVVAVLRPPVPTEVDDVRVAWSGTRLDVAGRAIAPTPRVVEVLFRVRGREGLELRVPQDGSGSFQAGIDTANVWAEWELESNTVDVFLVVDTGGEERAELRLPLPESATLPAPGTCVVLAPADEVQPDMLAWCYRTVGGNLSVRFAPRPRPTARVTCRRFDVGDGRVSFEAELVTSEVAAESILLEVAIRSSEDRWALPVTLLDHSYDVHRRLHRQSFRASLDFDRLIDEGLELSEDILDPLIQVGLQGEDEPRHLGIAAAGAARKRRLPHMTFERGGRTQLLVPYLTFKARRLAFHREVFATDDYRYLDRLARWRWAFALARPFAGVWLVGELPYKAQDTGFHLFRWIRENQPRRRAYYVIAADSPERANVEPLGNVVLARSREHIRYTFLARRIATSHHAEYALASRRPDVIRGARGVRVFLQHGVMGTKNMVPNYGRTAPEFRTDRFHVSSRLEREMIVNDFGFRPRQVRITGLSRFDTLLAPTESAPHGLLIVPTWRDWLMDANRFAESDYREQWHAVLHHETLQLAIAEGLKVTFILHPNMRQYADAFEAPGVTVVRQGEIDVQTLMRSHRALVTDYSSVGFDFSFQHRPVLYFQFDRSRFIGRRPSHLDLDADLPGAVARTADDLLALVEASRAQGFEMEPEYRRRADRFIEHRDRENCARVYESVRTAGGPGVPFARMRDSTLGHRVFGRYRRSRLYLPSMKALLAFARLLPRNRTVVLESGNGRQYSDSPRAIYEELVARRAPVRTVWVSSGTFRPADPTTRKVKPRSPRYFWELGRARYWVNNQNFPIFMKPSRRTFYLQTWHGTPLKRMQFDAVSTAGRNEGYLSRVSRMTGYWSALLSPSPFASEKFRSAFRFTGQVEETGYPRNDVLVSEQQAQRARLTRARLGLREDQKLVLYAPTFRDDVKVGGRFGFDSQIDFTAFAATLPADVVLLVRQHSVVRQRLSIPEEARGRVINVSSYPDAQDLLATVDALVTDYSSVMFDYALTRRPMVFFCYDLDHYRDDLRGFYLDFEVEAPGPVVTTQEGLFAALADLEDLAARYKDKVDGFARTYGPYEDGRSTARAVDLLLRH